jgi:hypothetical protein
MAWGSGINLYYIHKFTLLLLIAVCTPIQISLPIFLVLGSLKGLYHKFIFTTNIFRSLVQTRPVSGVIISTRLIDLVSAWVHLYRL